MASIPSTGATNQYLFVFQSAVLIANSCFDDFMALIQKKIKQQKNAMSDRMIDRDVLQSDITHYLRLTSFMNRFVWLFVVSPSTVYPCLAQMGDEEAMNTPTVDQVKHTTSQEFFISCLETCKVGSLDAERIVEIALR